MAVLFRQSYQSRLSFTGFHRKDIGIDAHHGNHDNPLDPNRFYQKKGAEGKAKGDHYNSQHLCFEAHAFPPFPIHNLRTYLRVSQNTAQEAGRTFCKTERSQDKKDQSGHHGQNKTGNTKPDKQKAHNKPQESGKP